MDASSIASQRDPSPALRSLALSAAGVASVAVVAAACVLIVRCGLGAIDPRTSGGFLAIAGSMLVLSAAGIASAWPLRQRRGTATTIKATPEPAAGVSSGIVPLPAATSPWPGARLVQRIERYERKDPEGSVVDAAVGRVVVHFPEGSRAAVAHVGFCPPFAATPRVAVSNECDGVEVNVAAPEVLPWGVRIECRLEEPSEEPLDVEVDIVAEPADAR